MASRYKVVFTIITVEDKLELFRKVVLEKVENEYEKKLSALDSKNAAFVEEYEVMIKQKSVDYVKNLTDQAEYERRMLISKARAKVRQTVMQKRQSIVDELLELVRKEAGLFVENPAYEKYLANAFKNALGEIKNFGKVIVSLDAGSFDKSKAILEKEFLAAGFEQGGFVFEKADDEMIGGVKFYNEGKSIRIDESFASLIDENKKLIGQYVYDMISEAGELNG